LANKAGFYKTLEQSRKNSLIFMAKKQLFRNSHNTLILIWGSFFWLTFFVIAIFCNCYIILGLGLGDRTVNSSSAELRGEAIVLVLLLKAI
jgi:hypothetical protein